MALETNSIKFKSYLHYKTITSGNVSSEAQIKFFLFRGKLYSVHSMIKQTCDVMMSIST